MAKRSKADVKHAIDLLWSHQIRRENAALHKEVKRLQQQVISQTDDVRELHASCEKAKVAAETAIACVEKALVDQTNLQTTVDAANRQAQEAIDNADRLEANWEDARASQTQTITHFNQNIDRIKADLSRLQEQCSSERGQTATSLRHLSAKLEDKPNRSEITRFEDRIDQFEALLHQGQNLHSVSGIEDSIGEQGSNFPGNTSQPNTLLTSKSRHAQSASNASVAEANEAEVMLTLRDADECGDETEVEDIDLDENVTMMSYAKNIQRHIPGADSLVPLPPYETQDTQAVLDQVLKQGRFHSWDRYFAEGQTLIKKLPRRHELDLVKRFVEGLYATKQREQCESWLDVNGWTWENVDGFGLSSTPSVPVHLKVVHPRNQDGMTEVGEKDNEDVQDPSEKSKPLMKPESSPKRNQQVGQKSVQGKSQPPRECSPAAKHARQSRGKGKLNIRSTKRHQSQRQSSVSATRRRDGKGRFRRRRSLSPILGENVSHSGVSVSRANRGKNVRRHKSKDDGSSGKPFNEAPRKQHIKAVRAPSEATTEMKANQQDIEPPSTPLHQQTPSRGIERTIPRLVRRKRSVDLVAEQRSRKRRQLMDEEGLPPLPAHPIQQHRKDRRTGKKRHRLPLPPPPEIPIMPTSDE